MPQNVSQYLLGALAATLALASPASGSRRAALDSALAVEARAGFSGVALVAQGDTTLFVRAYGGAAQAGVAPGELAFWIASDSKQFTATAILKLEQRGRLHTGDSLGRFFPRVPADKRAITVHQLLTHTSGLPTAYATEGMSNRDQAVAAILALPLGAKPGAKFSYSNDGYTLLAAIVEVASQVSFDSYLADSLIAPAGLLHTGLWGREPAGLVLAPPADPRRVARQKPTIYRDGHSIANWGFRGCTGVYSTAEDLHAWVRALQRGKVLEPRELTKLIGRHVLVRQSDTGESWTGYGWGVKVKDGRDISYGHVGSDDWLGQSSVIHWTPDGEVVVVLANSGEIDGDGWASRANRAVRRVLDTAP